MIEITDESFAEDVLDSEIAVLMDFTATWCGPCKKMLPHLKSLSEEIENVKFVKVDIDECSEISEIYRVSSVPTFVIVKNGKEVARRSGSCTRDEIERWILRNT